MQPLHKGGSPCTFPYLYFHFLYSCSVRHPPCLQRLGLLAVTSFLLFPPISLLLPDFPPSWTITMFFYSMVCQTLFSSTLQSDLFSRSPPPARDLYVDSSSAKLFSLSLPAGEPPFRLAISCFRASPLDVSFRDKYSALFLPAFPSYPSLSICNLFPYYSLTRAFVFPPCFVM